MAVSLYPCKLLSDVSLVELMLCRTYNDPGEGSNFINGTGAVDIYGLVGCRVKHD